MSLALAVTGFCLLGVGLLLARQTTPWPGYEAVLPILGALCLMAAGPHNAVSATVLCNRVSVFVGRISYPLYLWHWPLLSLAFIQRGGLTADTRLLRVGLVLLSFALAVATYLLVEKPIRFGQSARRAKVWGLVAGMALMAGAGGTIYGLAGLPERAKFREIQSLLKNMELQPRVNAAGWVYAGVPEGSLEFCRFMDAGAATTVAVIGDSHAASAYEGIARLGNEAGYNTILLGRVFPGGGTFDPRNQQYYEAIINILKRKQDITKIFIVTRGILYITGKRQSAQKQLDGIGNTRFKTELYQMINTLYSLNKEIYIVAENPESITTIKSHMRKIMNGEAIEKYSHARQKAATIQYQKVYLDILNNIPNATVIPTIDDFCPTEQCAVFSADGLPLYYDDDHLSVAGSIFQAEQILRPYLLRPRQP